MSPTRSPRREQRRDAATLRRLLAAHRDVQASSSRSAPTCRGSDPDVDTARCCGRGIDAFLRQSTDEMATIDDSWRQLHELVGGV